MTTPLLDVIHQAYPRASITYVAGTWSKVIPEHHSAVKEVIDSGTVGLAGHYSLLDYMKLVKKLRKLHFDLAFVLDRSPLLTLLPWLAGVPRRVGPDSLGRGFSLTDRVTVSTSPVHLQHQAEIYLDQARALGLPINTPRMRFETTEEERRRANKSSRIRILPLVPPDPQGGKSGGLISAQRVGGTHSQVPPFVPPDPQGSAQRVGGTHFQVALFPGGGSNPGMELTAKRWPLERYRELASKLVCETGAHVLLVGGPDDIALNQQLLERLDVPAGTVSNIAGKTSIGELAAQLEQCDLFIGNDSSPMHLAAAVGIPVIAIFGPTSPQEYGPYPLNDPKHIALWRHPTGQPCFFLGKMQTCVHCTCMQSVTLDEVWNAVQRLIPSKQNKEVAH